jgi:AbrB family transcriptional regulator (stage V sporulation protein T)
LEIFTDKDGEVIFKKYSPIGELGTFAAQYAETLTKTSGHPTIITDRDTVIAVSGAPKRELVEKKVSLAMDKVMEGKNTVITQKNEPQQVPVVDGDDKYSASVVCPIISEGDSIGAVAFLADSTNRAMGEVEEKLVQSAAGFLGKQMDEY